MKVTVRITTVVVFLATLSCTSIVDPAPFDCVFSTLDLTEISVSQASNCSAADGSLSVLASGGSGVYSYSINNGPTQEQATFESIEAGFYSVEVYDDLGCEFSLEVFVPSNSPLTIDSIESMDAGCNETNGILTVNASGGNNILYQLDDGDFVEQNVFTNLSFGEYKITIKDDSGCIFSKIANVKSGTPFALIRSVLDQNCVLSNCHDGSRQSLPDFSDDLLVQSNADNIKKFTANKSMPLSSSGLTLTDEQIAQIACWVDDGAILN